MLLALVNLTMSIISLSLAIASTIVNLLVLLACCKSVGSTEPAHLVHQTCLLFLLEILNCILTQPCKSSLNLLLLLTIIKMIINKDN